MGLANKLCYYYYIYGSSGGHAFLLKIRLCQVLALQIVVVVGGGGIKIKEALNVSSRTAN